MSFRIYKWLLLLALTVGGYAGWAKTQGFVFTQNQRSVKIPIEVRHNVVLIPLRINGSFEMHFILDTGVRTSILTEPMLARFLSIDSLRKVKVKGLGIGEPIDANLAQGVSMSLPGGVEGRGINLLVLPHGMVSYSQMFGKKVYGIIGYELFRQFAIEINYQQKYIRLWDPFKLKVRGKKWESLPIDIRHGKPYVDAKLRNSDGVEHVENWLIDTGASMAISLFDDEVPIPSPYIEAFLGQGLSGNVYGKLARSPSFEIGSFQLDKVITGFPIPEALGGTEQNIDWYGNIGAEVISRFRVIFDYTHEKVWLRKSSDFEDPFEYNLSGLELLSEGQDFSTFVISYVRPESPAAKVGIQVDDEIISLNGSSVNGLSIEDLYGGLSKRRGKVISIKIKRGDEVFRKKFRLIAEI